MKWIFSILLAAALVVGSLAASRAKPAQSSTVPCLCDGSYTATVFAHPWIATVSDSGEVQDGRCHKPPPSICVLQGKACHAQLNWVITANPGYLPNFEWTVDGISQPGGGYLHEFASSYDEWIPCGESRNVAIRANGAAVLRFVVVCADCSG